MRPEQQFLLDVADLGVDLTGVGANVGVMLTPFVPTTTQRSCSLA